ncbi:unnamed protein product [Arabis nemorensis]|uniref:Polygalacturonase n=1 Tax=Arabis nemorensis TaxID=586526 RepID=A0A565CMI2_9BRAS|nr:unnamed protein product [Arabis nemorensis]
MCKKNVQPFLKAWESVCKGGSRGKLLVSPGKTFICLNLLLSSVHASLPPISISLTIRGNLVAPSYTWPVGRYPTWISFDSINGRVVSGGGTIDGRGSLWWGKGHTRPFVSPICKILTLIYEL